MQLTWKFAQAMKYIDQAPDYDKKIELIHVSDPMLICSSSKQTGKEASILSK